VTDLIVRVVSPDYSTWLNAFVSAENGLVEAGINQWTVYQDTWNPNIVMVHFIADDLDRAMAFFGSDEFKDVNARSGATERRFFIASEQVMGAQAAAKSAPAAKKPAAKTTTKKTTAKPAATTSTEAAPAKKPSTRSTTKKTTTS
jgi:hypothetical protein